MSTPQRITVTRTYRLEPADCARAVALLLSKPARKKGGKPAPDTHPGRRTASGTTA